MTKYTVEIRDLKHGVIYTAIVEAESVSDALAKADDDFSSSHR